MSVVKTVVGVLAALRLAYSQQTGLGPYEYRPDSGLYDCDYVNSTYYACGSTPKNETFFNCICTQEFLTGLINCESETRLCYETYQYDNSSDVAISNWHASCDTRITFTPTTPVLSTLTATAGFSTAASGICNDLVTSCASFSAIEAACEQSHTTIFDAGFKQCGCSESLLSLASVCLYDGNITCLSRSAALSNIPLFNICGTTYSAGSMITAGLGGMVTSPTASSRASLTMASPTTLPIVSTSHLSQPISTQAATASTSAGSPTSSAASNAASKRLACDTGEIGMVLMMAVAVLFA